MSKNKRGRKKRRDDKEKTQSNMGSIVLGPVVAVIVLCALHFVLAITSVINKSNTYDEIAHLTRGYSYHMTGDFRLGPPHPPLAHIWASLPGRSMGVKFPDKLFDTDAWRESNVWQIGQVFFYYNMGNARIIDSLLWRGRVMIALWSTAICLIVFFWSRRLFGMAGGLISLLLVVFSPTMLAHGRLVTTDCGVALFFLTSLATIWWLLHRISVWSILAGAASLTCLFLTKMSAVLIIPVGIILLMLRLIDGRPLPISWRGRQWQITRRYKAAACFMAVMVFWIFSAWLGLWGVYGFRYQAMVNGQPGIDRFYSSNGLPEGKGIWEHQFRGLDIGFGEKINWLREHRIFPEAYIYSAAFSAQTARGRSAFLNGETSITGFAQFFPYCFAVKTPLPLFGMIFAAGIVPVYLKRRKKEAGDVGENSSGFTRVLSCLYRSSPLWVFFLAYWIVSLKTNLNIGHRHIMPTYPVLFILCGATAHLWNGRSRRLRAVVAGLSVLFVIASMSIYPNYLTYFNSLVGGPDKAYHHLVDSSLDWGQDLPGLKTYLDKRKKENSGREVFISYFGSGGNKALTHFGIKAAPIVRRLTEDATGDYRYRPGIYAISATNLQQVYGDVYGAGANHVWTEELETEYRKYQPIIEKFHETPDSREERGRLANMKFRNVFNKYQKLQFARLCEYLRRQEPDHIVNHTILIYDLDQKELNDALVK